MSGRTDKEWVSRRDFRTDQEWKDHVRRVMDEWFESRGYPGDTAYIRQQRERRRARKERQMKPKSEWSIADQLDDAAERIVKERDRALAARTKLRADLDGLADNRLLSDYGRRDLREKALATARAALVDFRAAQAMAAAVLERREALTSPARVLREAKFVRVDPDASAEVRELGLLREELTRQRLREELRDAPPEELVATIREAAATQHHALLHVAEQVVARRRRAGEPAAALDDVTLALIDARQQIELPKDVAKLSVMFDTIAAAAGDLDAAITELGTGREVDDAGAASRRISEIAAEGGTPLEIGQKYAAERQTERAQRATRAKRRAAELVQEAIAADEGDAFAIPNPNNPNPAA